MKRNNKAFTIVELVIVIGVIGILSAILVPTFVNLNKSAKHTSEVSFIRNVNLQLSMREINEGKNELCRHAVYDALDLGYDVLAFNSPDHELIYNEVVDRFYIANKDDLSLYYPKDMNINIEKHHLWRFIADTNIDNPEYSYYALNNFDGDTINLQSGFDAGSNWTINTINLDTTSRTSTTERRIKLITNGFNININAPYDNVSHYRYVYRLNITSVNNLNCYHENGYVENLVSFGNGKFVAEEKAQFKQKKSEIISVLSGKEYELKNDDENYNVERFFDEELGEVAERYIEPPIAEHTEEYNELPDLEPTSDISALVDFFNDADKTSYKSVNKSFFNTAGLKQYFRHYHKNYAQDKNMVLDNKSYYIYPNNELYLDYLNTGYVNINDNYYRFYCPGDTAEARLNSTVTQAHLRIVSQDKDYQDDLFTLDDIDEDYLMSKSFVKVNDNKYMSSSISAFNDFLAVCAPTLENTGNYMTFEKITIELLENDSLRIRIYADATQSGKTINAHKDNVNKPNWYMLFSEAVITDIGSTTFVPTSETTIGLN